MDDLEGNAPTCVRSSSQTHDAPLHTTCIATLNAREERTGYIALISTERGAEEDDIACDGRNLRRGRRMLLLVTRDRHRCHHEPTACSIGSDGRIASIELHQQQ